MCLHKEISSYLRQIALLFRIDMLLWFRLVLIQRLVNMVRWRNEIQITHVLGSDQPIVVFQVEIYLLIIFFFLFNLCFHDPVFIFLLVVASIVQNLQSVL